MLLGSSVCVLQVVARVKQLCQEGRFAEADAKAGELSLIFQRLAEEPSYVVNLLQE